MVSEDWVWKQVGRELDIHQPHSPHSLGRGHALYILLCIPIVRARFWYRVTTQSDRNEIIPFAATWTDLEIIILSEVNQKRER